MLFNSIAFLFFFPLTTAIYFCTPYRWRWLPMLAASAYFYMAFMPYYILILAFTILVDYFSGLAIASTQGKARTAWLLVSLTANLSVLATFKYWNFAVTSLAELMGATGHLPLLRFVLPLGLSFHTFQSMAYTIEIYRGNQPAERHLGYLALYVLFYPQLVAGPIERPQNLLHQFREPHDFDYTNATDGLKLMAWGFFKKCVIADRLAPLVDLVYNEPGLYRGLPLIVATVAFSFQIYCDFSGYSDIARGAARVLGIRLMNNFAGPYLATSIVDFWRRWHISLSTWFRDYLYVPLGGNRVSFGRKNLNVFIVFLLSGLWHGANWTFVIWGALHGLFFMVTRIFQSALPDREPEKKSGLPLRILQTLATFAVVSFAWIFFRARNVQDAFYIATHLFGPVSRSDPYLAPAGHSLLGIRLDLWIAAALVAVLLIVERIQGVRELPEVVRPCRGWLRWSVYYALILVIFVLGVFAESPFIYFQF